MSLVKSPTMTPAKLAANRRNLQKALAAKRTQARLRAGSKSEEFWPTIQYLFALMLRAPQGQAAQRVRDLLTAKQTAHPVYARVLAIASRHDLIAEARGLKAPGGRGAQKKLRDESRNVIENTRAVLDVPDLQENTSA